MTIRLQRAEVADADLISDLDCTVFPEEGFGPTVMRQEIKHGWAVLAYDGATPVGYAVVRPGAVNDLTRLGVLESHRGKKIGKMLLEMVKEQHKGQVMLLVRRTNQHAINLYLKTGFTIMGMRETSWLMVG